jgi:hypothetical protein
MKSYIWIKEEGLKRKHTREFKLECGRQGATARNAPHSSAVRISSQKACCSEDARSTRQEAKRPSP